jgi:hypothetical protein
MRTLKGRVEFRDLEGGVFQLVGDDGARTTLVGGKKELKGHVGKRVEVDVEEDGGFGLAMAGPQARVVRVKG